MITLPVIPPIDEKAVAQAAERQNLLTKPACSLGVLENLSIRLAGITGNPLPEIKKSAVIVMAADHGIVKEGVSAYPSDVTRQMVLNFLAGGAAINVLARQNHSNVIVVDIGVASDFDEHADLIRRKVAYGTANMLKQPAMTPQQAEQAIQIGIDIAAAQSATGVDILATGEMGIGNTTPSSAITAVFTGLPIKSVTGRGTGVDDRGLKNKILVIEKILQFHQPDKTKPFEVLCQIGGLEIAGLAGVIIGSSSKRTPVVIDGFISGAAALIAYELCPSVKPYVIASHQSVEIGHQAILSHIGLKPLFDLELRLGEGTGAVLAIHLVDAATRILREMATFEQAGVSGKE